MCRCNGGGLGALSQSSERRLPAPPPLAHSSVGKDPKKCTFGGSLNFVGIKSFTSFPCSKVRVARARYRWVHGSHRIC